MPGRIVAILRRAINKLLFIFEKKKALFFLPNLYSSYPLFLFALIALGRPAVLY